MCWGCMCAGVVEYQSEAAGKRGSWLSPVPCQKRTKRTLVNESHGLASATVAEKTCRGSQLCPASTKKKECTKIKNLDVACGSQVLPQRAAAPLRKSSSSASTVRTSYESCRSPVVLFKEQTHKHTAAAQSQGVTSWGAPRASHFCCCLRLPDGGVVPPLPILLTASALLVVFVSS